MSKIIGIDLGTTNSCVSVVEGGVPVITVDCGEVTDRKVGELFFFLQLACGISAYTLGVNPFDQPGVEAYKRNMFNLLGKPADED